MISIFKPSGGSRCHADVVDPGSVFAHVGDFDAMAGQSDHGMVPGNRRITHEDALLPLNAAADAAKEYLVGQREAAGHTVFVLPLQLGLESGVMNVGRHLGQLPLMNDLSRFTSEWTTGTNRISDAV
jgi:hypothetical protein